MIIDKHFTTIDELLNELNLIQGTTLFIGGETNYFDCCHLEMKENVGLNGVKEGWIDSIHTYFHENSKGDIETVADMSICLNVKGFFDRPTINVDKSWFDKHVREIHIWTSKDSY